MNPQDGMNNGNNNYFNRPVRQYSWNNTNPDVSDPTPTSSQLQPAVAPEVRTSTPSHVVDSSPWVHSGVAQSGFSSISSPGTSSSSPNSIYGQSQDDLSIDSLINSLLRVVNGDDFNARKSNFRRTSPVANCRDCTDVACEACYNSYGYLPPQHQQRRSPIRQSMISPHVFLTQCDPTVRPLSADIPPPILMHEYCASPGSPLYCELHRETQRYYCQTCSRPFCAECGLHQHVGHSSVHLIEAIEKAGQQANQVLNEANLIIHGLKDDMDTLQVASTGLEQRSRQATTDVLLCVRRILQALEAREQELCEKIEKNRESKKEALKARDEHLRAGVARLQKATDRLQRAMEAATLASNPFDLLVTKDMASAEIFQMKNVRKQMQPLEENWISFNGPETNLLSLVSNLGSVITSNPGPIGDRRTVRGRGTGGGVSPQYFRGGSPNSLSSNQSFPLTPVPRGRAIPASGYPVVINNGLIDQQSPKLPVVQIGNSGDMQDNLCRPWGVTCDRDGNVIVADRSNNRIQIFRKDGQFVRRFGTHGTGPGEFDRPAGIAVDSRRRIIVADKDNHRVQVLTMEGQFLLSFGEKGSRLGQFNYPWDVAVNSECQIVVSDTRNHRVQLFSPEGIFLRKYGFETINSMWKNFDSPRGVAFNPEGNIAVTDFNNHRVVIIDADFMNSRVLGCDVGHGNRQVQRPQGLIVDDEGNIIVADSRNHRVLIFDSTGTLKGHVGTADRGPEQMDRPSGVALTPDGRILVVDFGNNRVLLI